MSKQFWVFLVVGIAAVAGLVAGIFFLQRGAHVELRGAVLKVRTAALDESSSVAVIDFRFVNPSDYPFIVRDVYVTAEEAGGGILDGAVVSETDARRVFEYYPVLGQKYNESLLMRARVGARLSMDRMIAARFEVPEGRLLSRKAIRIRVEDVDGAVSEIVEERRSSPQSR
jgi:hypothetical protein